MHLNGIDPVWERRKKLFAAVSFGVQVVALGAAKLCDCLPGAPCNSASNSSSADDATGDEAAGGTTAALYTTLVRTVVASVAALLPTYLKLQNRSLRRTAQVQRAPNSSKSWA